MGVLVFHIDRQHGLKMLENRGLEITIGPEEGVFRFGSERVNLGSGMTE